MVLENYGNMPKYEGLNNWQILILLKGWEGGGLVGVPKLCAHSFANY